MAQTPPIVAHGFWPAHDRNRPYRLPPVHRVVITHHTAQKVSIRTPQGIRSIDRGNVWCLPDAAAWDAALRDYQALQAALDALRAQLVSLGSYMDRRDAQGGMERAPNPLCATVIGAPVPDFPLFDPPGRFWGVPKVIRRPIERHTPKMLVITRPASEGPKTAGPAGWWFCPDDAAWAEVQRLHTAAIAADQTLQQRLDALGTYGAALADRRYASTHPMLPLAS